MTGWARYEVAEEKVLSERGLAKADPGLQHRLMEITFQAPASQRKVTQGQKVRQIKNTMGMRNIMNTYDIHDTASYLNACKQVNDAFYKLRHDLKETEELLALVDNRITTMEQYKQHKALYQQYAKQPDRNRAAFYEAHRAELVIYEAAERKLKQWKDSGEEISTRKWRECRKHLQQKHFVLEFDLRGMKDTVHYLEMVKHAFIEDQKKVQQNTRDEHGHTRHDEPAI